MTRSRNGIILQVGQAVSLIPSMGVNEVTDGVISSIDGEYIMVDLVLDGVTVPVERYGCEIIA